MDKNRKDDPTEESPSALGVFLRVVFFLLILPALAVLVIRYLAG
jgi:hypothetical protein